MPPFSSRHLGTGPRDSATRGPRTPDAGRVAAGDLELVFALRSTRADRACFASGRCFVPFIDSRMCANYPRIFFKYLVAYCYFALARLSCFRRRCRVRRCIDYRRLGPLHAHDSSSRVYRRRSRSILVCIESLIKLSLIFDGP